MKRSGVLSSTDQLPLKVQRSISDLNSLGYLGITVMLSPISTLPQALLQLIFSFLSLKDMGRATRVCKQWKTEAWKTLKKLDLIQTHNIYTQKTRTTESDLARVISQCPHLEEIDAFGCERFTDNVLNYAKNLNRLTSLNLKLSAVTPKSLQVLEHFTSLRKLWLMSGLLNKDIIFLPKLVRLEVLSISSSYITDEGLHYITGLTELKELHLSGCHMITDAGISSIVHLSNLESLWLSYTSVTDICLRHLIHLTKLETLVLASCKITDMGLNIIAMLSSLKRLSLSYCYAITDAGMEVLSKLKLSELAVVGCNISQNKGLDNPDMQFMGSLNSQLLGQTSSLQNILNQAYPSSNSSSSNVTPSYTPPIRVKTEPPVYQSQLQNPIHPQTSSSVNIQSVKSEPFTQSTITQPPPLMPMPQSESLMKLPTTQNLGSLDSYSNLSNDNFLLKSDSYSNLTDLYPNSSFNFDSFGNNSTTSTKNPVVNSLKDSQSKTDLLSSLLRGDSFGSLPSKIDHSNLSPGLKNDPFANLNKSESFFPQSHNTSAKIDHSPGQHFNSYTQSSPITVDPYQSYNHHLSNSQTQNFSSSSARNDNISNGLSRGGSQSFPNMTRNDSKGYINLPRSDFGHGNLSNVQSYSNAPLAQNYGNSGHGNLPNPQGNLPSAQNYKLLSANNPKAQQSNPSLNSYAINKLKENYRIPNKSPSDSSSSDPFNGYTNTITQPPPLMPLPYMKPDSYSTNTITQPPPPLPINVPGYGNNKVMKREE